MPPSLPAPFLPVAIFSNVSFLSPLLAGYDRSLPGFPRYTVLGHDTTGVFSLKITNATLTDDATYECQVGPAPGNKPIRASARIGVLRKSINRLPLAYFFESLKHLFQSCPFSLCLLQCRRPRLSCLGSSRGRGWK